MNDYYSALLIALIVIVLLVALTLPAVMMSFKRKQDTSNSGTAPTTGAGDDKSKPAAKAAEPEKKKAKEKKLEVTWSWWLFLYSFLIAGFVIPSLMADSLSTRDTWLLVILVSVAATYAVATMVKYQFDFDDAVGKVNKIAVGLLILGIAFLLFQNNFSTTATLKDAGTRTSGFTSGIKEFLAGKRYGSATTAPAATATTTLCTAANFIDGTVSSTTESVRFEAERNCPMFIPFKSQGVPIEVRFNDGPWQRWETGPAPKSSSTIRTMDVRLVSPGAAYVKVAFGQ